LVGTHASRSTSVGFREGLVADRALKGLLRP